MTKLQTIGAILLLPALIVVAYITFVQWNGNFHVVEEGELYRVSRVSPDRLTDLVHRYGIKSVLNLEGARPDKTWYRDEIDALNRLDVHHYDYRISATQIVPPENVQAILSILRQAPKPVLVQCKDGADRSGLIAALYLAKIRGRNQDEAYAQLSMEYGHFQYLGSDTEEMDDTYWLTVDPVGHPD